MRPQVILSCFVLALFVQACVSSRADKDTELRRLMDVARTLEGSRNLKEASLQYAMIAERFPNSSAFPAAARKAALLYANPANPSRNDSLSLFWWRRYLESPLPVADREDATLAAYLLATVDSLRTQLARQTALSDSLFFSSRKQANALALQDKRIQELDTELRQTAEELRKLKEIDVKLSKTRQR